MDWLLLSIGIWAAWLLYWVYASRTGAKTAERESATSPWLHLSLMAASFGSLFVRVSWPAFLGGSVQLKESHVVVRTGPYRMVRHPIYAGVLLAMLGTAIVGGRVQGLLAAPLMFAAYVRKIGLEEGPASPRPGRGVRQVSARGARPDPLRLRGVAMTLFQPLWPTRPGPQDLPRGWDEAEKAKALEPPTPREQLLVAESVEQWAAARRLVEEYAASLEVDLSFQNFEDELGRLPREYGPPDGVFLLAEQEGAFVGCVGLRRFSGNWASRPSLHTDTTRFRARASWS